MVKMLTDCLKFSQFSSPERRYLELDAHPIELLRQNITARFIPYLLGKKRIPALTSLFPFVSLSSSSLASGNRSPLQPALKG
jgi:hypothetical protein